MGELHGYIKDALLALAAGYVGIMTWVFSRQIARIDAMEKAHHDYITRDEFNRHLTDLKKELREEYRGTQTRLDTVISLLLRERRPGQGDG